MLLGGPLLVGGNGVLEDEDDEGGEETPLSFFRGSNLVGMEGPYTVFTQGTGPAAGTQYAVHQPEIVDYLNGKNFKILRIIFGWDRIQSALNATIPAASGNYKDYYDNLKAIVDYVTSVGMVVLLEPWCPNSSGGTMGPAYRGSQVGAGTVTQAHFTNFWSQMAEAYADNPLVWIGLVNEPNGMDTMVWFGIAQATINAIRGAGFSNYIVVPGNGYTGAHSWLATWPDAGSPQRSNAYGWLNANGVGQPLTDSENKLIVGVHQYADGDFSGSSDTVTSQTILSEKVDITVDWARTNGLKVFVGEVGVYAGATNAPEAWDDFAAFALANQDVLVGWTWWACGKPAYWDDVHAGKFSITPTGGYTTDTVNMNMIEGDFFGGVNRTLPITVKNFILNRNAAVLHKQKKVTAALGTFAETGIAVAFIKLRKISAVVGTFVETGIASSLTTTAQKRITAVVRNFIETGIATGLRAQRKLVAALGTFVETGIAAGLSVANPLSLSVAVGTFVLTGKTTLFKIPFAKGTFVETGNATGLTVQRKISCTVETFTLTGIAAGLGGASIDPSTLSPHGYWKGSYSGNPWVGAVGGNLSQSNSSLRPTVGSSLDGVTPADFNGTSQLVAGSAISNFVAAGAFGLAALIKPTSGGGSNIGHSNRTFVSDSVASGYWGTTIWNSGADAYVFASGSYRDGVASGSPVNNWLAVFVKMTGNQISVSINSGAWGTAVNTVGNIDSLAGLLTLGVGYSGSVYFAGSIMEVWLRKTAITDGERNGMYAWFKATYPSAGLP